MRDFIFRDIYTGRLFRVRDYTPMSAMRKLSQERRIPIFNIVRVQKKHALYASR